MCLSNENANTEIGYQRSGIIAVILFNHVVKNLEMAVGDIWKGLEIRARENLDDVSRLLWVILLRTQKTKAFIGMPK